MFTSVAILAATPDFTSLGLPVPVLTGTFDEIARSARNLGLDGLEYMPDPENLPSAAEISRALRNSGIKVSQIGATRLALQGYGLLHTDPTVRRESLRLFEGLMRLAADLGTTVGLGSARGRVASAAPENEQLPLLLDVLGAAVDFAASCGTSILLEPVPSNQIAGPGTVAQVAEIVRLIDSPHLEIMLDTAQLRMEEQSIQDAIDKARGLTNYIQLFDNDYWPPGVLPDDQAMDWASVSAGLHAIDFNGTATIMPAKSGDVDALTCRAVHYVREVLGA